MRLTTVNGTYDNAKLRASGEMIKLYNGFVEIEDEKIAELFLSKYKFLTKAVETAKEEVEEPKEVRAYKSWTIEKLTEFAIANNIVVPFEELETKQEIVNYINEKLEK